MYGFGLPLMPTALKATTAQLNNRQYYEVFNRVVNIALSRFKWNGLPDTCRPNILEETLLFYGCALFFFDENLGYAHTPVELPGPPNIYYESTVRMAHSFEYHESYGLDNSVLIKANYCMYPDYLTIWNYTPKIANAIRAIDVHLETLKRPFLVSCEEKEKTSVQKAINKIADNEIAVVGQKIGDTVKLEVQQLTNASYLTDMWATVKNYLNQVYSALGVRNSYTNKRERMITSEAEGEGNAIRHTLESELEMRQRACDEINDKYGLNISVEANELETFTEETLEREAARVTGMINERTGGVDDVSEN